MARKGGGGGDVVGTASVELEASIVLDEESLQQIKQQLESETSPVSERGKGGRGAARDAAPAAATVDTKVKAKVENDIKKDVQDVFRNTKFGLQINAEFVRQQIEEALQHPFNIVVNAEVRGAAAAAGVGVAHGPAVTAGAPVGRGPTPENIADAMVIRDKKTKTTTQAPFVGGINELYRNINAALGAVNKPRFGRQEVDELGNEVEKAAEMVEAFGDSAKEWFQVTKSGPGGLISQLTGGPIFDFLKGQGADPTLVQASVGAFGGENRRTADIFFKRLSDWVHTTPETPQPAAAVQPTIAPQMGQIALMPNAAAEERAREAEAEAKATQAQIRAERQKDLTIQPVNPQQFNRQFPGVIPGSKSLRPSDDTEADRMARLQLGVGERANVRRRSQRVPVESVGGLTANLEPFLRLAAMGRFTNVFERFGGKGNKESQGLVRIEPESAFGAEELRRLRGGKPGVRRSIAGQEGMFTALRPSQAFSRFFTESLGIGEGTGAGDVSAIQEQVTAFLARPEVAEQIKKQLAVGENPLRPARGATKRGQGKTGVVSSGTDLGRQAERVFEWMDELDGKISNYSETLDGLNRDIERAQGSGQDVSGLEAQARDLSKSLQRFRRQRGEAQREHAELTRVPSVEEARAMAAGVGARNADYAERVAQGAGLTPAEIQAKEFAATAGGRTKTRLEGMGFQGGDLTPVLNALRERYIQDPNRVTPTGELLSGAAQMRRTAFGRKGTEGEGLLGELKGMIPADVGPTQRREMTEAFRSVLQGAVSDTGFRQSLTEEDVRRREQMPRMPMQGRRVASAIASDEGIEIASFNAAQTGEGQFIGNAPGVKGAQRAELARAQELQDLIAKQRRARSVSSKEAIGRDIEAMLKTGDIPGTETARSRLESGEALTGNLLAEVEKAASTRIRTLGSFAGPSGRMTPEELAAAPNPATLGRYQTGAGATDIARGLQSEQFQTMPETPGEKAFEAFARQYGGAGGGGAGAGAGGGRGAAGGGAGGGGGFEGVTGPIHVIVDNVPLAVTWSGDMPSTGGGKRRRGRGGATDEELDQFFTNEERLAAAQPQAPKAPKARELRRKAMPTRDLGTAVDPRKIYTFDETLTEQREIAARERARARTFPERGPTAAETDFVSALQYANAPAREREREAEAKRLRRVARVSDPVGFAAAQDTEDTLQRELRGQLRTLNRRIPRRGFGASLTDLISSLAPGSGALERQLEAGDLATREATEIAQTARQRAQTRTTRRSLVGRIREERAAGRAGGEQETALLAQYREQVQVGRNLNAVMRESSSRFKGFYEEATRGTTVLKSFGAAAIGSIGSIGINAISFGIGAAIVAPLISAVAEGVNQGLAPAIERATGFQATAARTTLAASEEIRARGGDTGGAVAGIGARTGISAAAFERVSPLITQRADVEAGNQALREQIDLLHTSEQLTKQQQGLGVDRGLIATTGGAFGTPLFGIPSTQELLNKELEGLTTEFDRPTPQQAADRAAGIGGSVARPIPGNFRGSFAVPPIATPLGTNTSDVIKKFDEDLAKGSDRLEFFNDAAEKGGSSMRLVAASSEEAARSAKAARDAGLFDLADTLEKQQLQVRGAQSGSDIQSFLASINRGATTPDTRLLLEEGKRQRDATIQLEDTMRDFQINTTGPQQTAIALAQRPLAPAASGINLSGVSSGTQKSLNADLAQTQKLYDGINKEIDVGISQAKEFVATTFAYDPKVGEDFAKSLDKVVDYGKQISQIEIGLQTKQAAYQAAQFNYQINIAKRSLADAKGLAGELTNASKDNLGVLEREQFLLQRRAQAMQLELNQRQINFQRAVAGFTAPGLTGEERAARIEQAKIEADYAQKQLNIQKQLASLQGRQFQVTASRSVRDLTEQLSLLERGRVISLETTAAEKKIRALTILQEKENKKVQSYYEAAIQRTSDIAGEVAKLAAATGKTMSSIATDVLDAFHTSITGMFKAVSAYTNSGHGGAAGYGQYDSKSAGRAAGGNVMAGVGYWVGEQGKEWYQPERNGTITPESMLQMGSPMGGETSVTNITVMVTGNNVSSEEELRKLEERITEAVTRAQSRKISLLGGRTY